MGLRAVERKAYKIDTYSDDIRMWLRWRGAAVVVCGRHPCVEIRDVAENLQAIIGEHQMKWIVKAWLRAISRDDLADQL